MLGPDVALYLTVRFCSSLEDARRAAGAFVFASRRPAMAPSPADTLRDWRDFYMLAGAASATLVGLMFVAASIGASVFDEKHSTPMRAFITPTVVHFASILFASLLLTAPGHNPLSLACFLGVGGFAGLAYCVRVLALVFRRFRASLDWEDRAFYAIIPGFGYVLLLVAAAMTIAGEPGGGAIFIAAAMAILLAAGLRNAWDMMVWLSVHAPTAAPSPTDPDAKP